MALHSVAADRRRKVIGDSTAAQTLQQMRALVREACGDPRVIDAARRVIDGCKAHDSHEQARVIRAWLASRLIFARDPVGWEVLADPRFHLQTIAERGSVRGDCDDAATLGATIAAAVGIQSELVAVAFRAPNAPFQHVYAVLRTGRGPVDLDTTRPPRTAPPPVTRRLSLPV